jgi:hypothetical protein
MDGWMDGGRVMDRRRDTHCPGFPGIFHPSSASLSDIRASGSLGAGSVAQSLVQNTDLDLYLQGLHPPVKRRWTDSH